jgi:hypothetical protein
MHESAPPSSRSGAHRIADGLLAQLGAVVRPPAKVRTRRDEFARAALCRFRAVVDHALAHGHSFRSLARDAECTVRHVLDCYEGARNVPAWLFDAMPSDSRAEGVRVEIEQLRKVS